MRILLTTRGSAGHVTPLAPFGHAALRAGHDVLVAAQGQHAGNVARAGLPFAPFGEPPPEQWMPLLADFAQMDMDRANAVMIGDYFARMDTAAALPGLRTIVEDWRPDVIVRDCWEFASTLVAELHHIPVARVALGLAAVEELTIGLAAAALDRARAGLGLPPDPAGDRLRDTPFLTTIPQALEDPAVPAAGPIHRFRHAVSDAAAPLGDWWPGNDERALVYLTFGSVTAGAHLPYFPALYRAAIDALAPLPVRVLLTIGDRRDPAELGRLPDNVHVEEWVAQDAVAPHAAAIVGHGGHGTTLGALAHGVPQVVVPLFSVDQWANAAAIARAGAGVALDAERRTVLGRPGPETMDALGPAVQRVLADPSHRREAQRIAGAMRAQPPAGAAVEVLAALRARARA